MNFHPKPSPDPTAVPTPPDEGRIRVLENSGERLRVVFLPNKVGSTFDSWFLKVGVLHLALMTLVWFLGVKPAQKDPPWLFPLVLVVFWIVLLGMVYAFFRSRNRTVLLSVDRHQCVQRVIVFGRSTTTEISVTPDTVADMTLPSSESGSAPGDVCISGAGQSLAVDVALFPNEKIWLIDRINSVLKVKDSDAVPSHDESPARCPQRLRLLQANELPSGSPIFIAEDSPHRLQLVLANSPGGIAQWIGSVVVLAICGSGVRSQIQGRLAEAARWGTLLPWAIAFHIVIGVLFASFLLYFIWRKTTIDLTPEKLEVRFGLGWLSRTTLLSTAEIRGIVVSRRHRLSVIRDLPDDDPDAVLEETTDCLVLGDHTRVVVLEDRSLVAARHVTGLLWAKLLSWDHTVEVSEETMFGSRRPRSA